MLDIVVRHGPVSSIEPSAADGGSGEAIQTPLSTLYYLLSTPQSHTKEIVGGCGAAAAASSVLMSPDISPVQCWVLSR